MAINRPKPEEIVFKLRQVEFLMGQGMPRIDAIRQISVTEQTYYLWKKKHGGMGIEQLKELKRLQKENERRLYRRYLGEARAQRAKALRAWCAFNRDENQNSRNELKLHL